jgi:hypothetical protein
MALPRLPPVLKEGGERRMGGKVPPTPTRLAAGAQNIRPISSIAQQHHHQPHHPQLGRSPPGPSIPIASTLVPPTPSSLQHPGYTGDKTAFLAPFEVFYDALNDSKKLKGWLGDQLARSNTLLSQQENMAEHIESIVEKKMGGFRKEIAGLNRRVEELEEALRAQNHQMGFRRGSVDYSREYYPQPPPAPGHPSKGKQSQKNGAPPAESYQFPLPPANSTAVRMSPMWERENPMESSTRMSSSRLEPPPHSHPHPPRAHHSPPKRERSSSRASTNANPMPLSRQHSNSSPRTREREPPPPPLAPSRRGDTVMAPPTSESSSRRGD